MAHGSPCVLFLKLPRNNHTVSCAALGTEVPGRALVKIAVWFLETGRLPGSVRVSWFLYCSLLEKGAVSKSLFDCLFFDKGGPKVVANGFAKESENSWERFVKTFG